MNTPKAPPSSSSTRKSTWCSSDESPFFSNVDLIDEPELFNSTPTRHVLQHSTTIVDIDQNAQAESSEDRHSSWTTRTSGTCSWRNWCNLTKNPQWHISGPCCGPPSRDAWILSAGSSALLSESWLPEYPFRWRYLTCCGLTYSWSITPYALPEFDTNEPHQPLARARISSYNLSLSPVPRFYQHYFGLKSSHTLAVVLFKIH